MIPAVRRRDQITQVFEDQLSPQKTGREPNWHLPILLEDVRRYLRRRNVPFSSNPTSYARFMLSSCEEVLQNLQGTYGPLRESLVAVIATGPVALGYADPFRVSVDGQRLGPRTYQLVWTIYNWLFTFLGKSQSMGQSRFLDADLVFPLDLAFFFSEPCRCSPDEIQDEIRTEFTALRNFSPPLRCRFTSVDDLTLESVLTGYTILGWDQASQTIQRAIATLGGRGLYRKFQESVTKVARECLALKQGERQLAVEFGYETDALVANYWSTKNELPDRRLVCLDLLAPQARAKNPWFSKNALFFDHLLRGDIDEIVVEDGTRRLQDEKGFEKANQFTISRVKGLKAGRHFVPADRVVIKLRGFSHYRGEINNQLDLIKEFMSYVFIQEKVAGPAPHLLSAGPLLLTCERLNAPFDPEEKKGWLGLFLEEVPPPDAGRLFTCRVHRLSDFWNLQTAARGVMQAARQHNVYLNRWQLLDKLRELSTWLWSAGLSLDYCDLMLEIDEEGGIRRLRIMDLERLSFSELVNEDHVILDTVIDVKTHLQKQHWYAVLENLYRPGPSPDGLGPFSEIRKYLKEKGKKRWLLLKILRRLEAFINRHDSKLARLIWRRAINMLGRLFMNGARRALRSSAS